MSQPSDPQQANLVLTNTCSRLGISVKEARKRLGWDKDDAPAPTSQNADTEKTTTPAPGEDLL